MTLEIAQDAIVSLRQAEATKQPFRRPPAGGVAEQSNQVCHAAGLPRIWFCHSGRLAGKGLTVTGRIVAVPADHAELERDRLSLHGQILKAAHISTVSARRACTAIWAGSGPIDFSGDDPCVGRGFSSGDPDARTGLPIVLALASSQQ